MKKRSPDRKKAPCSIPFLSLMKNAATFALAGASFLPSLAAASQATVIKVKGQQAIVQFPADTVPVAGQKIEVAPVEGMSATADTNGNESRAHTAAISANLSLLSNSNSGNSSSTTNSTNIILTGLYGWNMEIIEIGPSIGLTYASSSGASTTSFQGGGFIDYNLLPNRAGVKFVAGLGAQAYLGETSPSAGSSTTLFGVAGGGQLKWFCFGHQTALRGDLLADYEQQASTITTTRTGVVMKLGVQTYF